MPSRLHKVSVSQFETGVVLILREAGALPPRAGALGHAPMPLEFSRNSASIPSRWANVLTVGRDGIKFAY